MFPPKDQYNFRRMCYLYALECGQKLPTNLETYRYPSCPWHGDTGSLNILMCWCIQVLYVTLADIYQFLKQVFKMY